MKKETIAVKADVWNGPKVLETGSGECILVSPNQDTFLYKNRYYPFPLVLKGKLKEGFSEEGSPFYMSGATGNGTVGTDPEVFAFREDGRVLPAWEWLPTQSNPLQAPSPNTYSGNTANAYWDGVQAEFSFSVKTPVSCIGWLIEDVRAGLRLLQSALPKGATLQARDVVELEPTLLESAQDEHILLGCAPSANAYDTSPISVPDPRQLQVRFAGTHLHCVHPGDAWNLWEPKAAARIMDQVCGVVLTALGGSLEDKRRRQYYGRPGEFRSKQMPQGGKHLEYRTPASWLLRSPQLFNIGMDLGRAAMKFSTLWPSLPLGDVACLIQESDVEGARKHLTTHKTFFTSLFSTLYGPLPGDTLWALCMKGVEGTSLATQSIRNAWKLAGPWGGVHAGDFGKWCSSPEGLDL